MTDQVPKHLEGIDHDSQRFEYIQALTMGMIDSGKSPFMLLENMMSTNLMIGSVVRGDVICWSTDDVDYRDMDDKGQTRFNSFNIAKGENLAATYSMVQEGLLKMAELHKQGRLLEGQQMIVLQDHNLGIRANTDGTALLLKCLHEIYGSGNQDLIDIADDRLKIILASNQSPTYLREFINPIKAGIPDMQASVYKASDGKRLGTIKSILSDMIFREPHVDPKKGEPKKGSIDIRHEVGIQSQRDAGNYVLLWPQQP